MVKGRIQHVLLRLLSVSVTVFVLASIVVVQAGLVGGFYVLLAVLVLASAVALRYAALSHQFSKPLYGTIACILPLVVLSISGVTALETALPAVSTDEFRRIFQRNPFDTGIAGIPSEWWLAVLLASAGVLTVIGSIEMDEPTPYPKPSELSEIATSPAYFGAVCIFFGLWAVLFVGIGIQRVLIIAPVFEELLKFGVALLVGSVLFGRSLVARVGVAVVVGSLFGVVEHATTYPMETDATYLFRTGFHGMTTVLSVSVYTAFEHREETALRWIAPVYPVLLHFFNNTFAVLSTVIAVFVPGAANPTVSLIYGFAVILLTAIVLLLSFVSRSTLVAIHVPFRDVLSDLV